MVERVPLCRGRGRGPRRSAVIGVSAAAVSRMRSAGTLEVDTTAPCRLLAYCARLRERVAGLLGSEIAGLDLVQERAALAREQRLGYEIKNAVARGEYAPIGVLADVLAAASRAIVDRFDMLPGQLKKVCPDLPDEARQRIEAMHADARNEWHRSTAELVSARLSLMEFDDPAEVAENPAGGPPDRQLEGGVAE